MALTNQIPNIIQEFFTYHLCEEEFIDLMDLNGGTVTLIEQCILARRGEDEIPICATETGTMQ